MLKVNVIYEEGRKNFIADTLSRLNLNEDTNEQIQVASATPLMDHYINKKIISID